MPRFDSIEDFRVFDAVARTGSFSAASRELALSVTSVSKRLKRLEETLQLRLVQRSTRRVSITAEGQQFHERCRAVLAAVEDAQEMGPQATLEGVIRVTASAAFAQRQIAPRLPRFLAEHPGVEVQILPADGFVNLIEQRIDLAFRQAPLDDGRHITRTIGEDALILCASPEYLVRCGTPQEPLELANHAALTVGSPPPTHWTLRRGTADHVETPIRSVVSSLEGEIPHAVALAGGGIAMKSAWDVIEDMRAGRLVRVLPQWWGNPRMVRVVYPMRAHQPRRVRSLIDFFETELRRSLHDNADLGLFPSTAAPAAAATTAFTDTKPAATPA
jgi:DNA-binding transcriptional LysR family regulator